MSRKKQPRPILRSQPDDSYLYTQTGIFNTDNTRNSPGAAHRDICSTESQYGISRSAA
ncbi:MAG: hypothetical protein QM763_09900 [Agriterribacter sp.]